MRVIVIGSGMSGLTAAAYLTQAGHEVGVLEQFPTIGGVTATLKQDGYGWDLGPLLLEKFLPGETAHKILGELGVVDQIRVVREDRGISFPDFALWKPEEYGGPYWRRERLKELFRDDADGLDRYYRFYDQMMDLMTLARRAEEPAGVAALLLKLRMWLVFRKVKAMADWSASQVLDHFFTRPELKALYSAILADFVVFPSEFPGLGIPGCNVETAFDRRMPLQVSRAGPRLGYGYVLGGVGEIVEALAGAITTNGGEIHTSTLVEKIVVVDGKATGVRLAGGRVLPADIVLASGGAKRTFYALVGKEHLTQEYIRGIEALQPMESVLMVHLGVDMDPGQHQPAALCYYYGSYDIEAGVRACRGGHYHEGKDGFLIYVPSMHSPELAPAGHHAVTIYTIAPNVLSEGTWKERGAELAEKLVAEAERFVPGLREHTQVQVILTPEDFKKRTHLEHHAFGGIAPVMGKENPAHETPVAGLWFIGAQSESGGGVAGVMIGARNVSRLLNQALGDRPVLPPRERP
jgi:phytoene dehydrogenase-like protein